MIIDSFENKEKILLRFLDIAGLDGWNQNNLIEALKDCEIDEKYLLIIFPNKILDLIDFHVEYFNQKNNEEILLLENFTELKTREKISKIIYQRFLIEKNHHLALKRLVNFYTNPKNFFKIEPGIKPIFHALKCCYKIADNAWMISGDKSNDFNYYTKRLILSKIIIRCFFIFINDEDDFKKTKNKIDNEIQKVMLFNKFKYNLINNTEIFKNNIENIFLNSDSNIKSPKEIIKSLPFIRLLKL